MATAPKAKSSGDFELCPAGVQQLVCCDIIDLGEEKSTFAGQEGKMQHKVRLRFQSSAKDSKGRPFLVQRKFTWSMFKSAGLRKFLENWRGATFTDADADMFDFDVLLGMNGFGTVSHVDRKGTQYADLMGMMACPATIPPIPVQGYIRVQDRPEGMPAAGYGDPEPDGPATAASKPAAASTPAWGAGKAAAPAHPTTAATRPPAIPEPLVVPADEDLPF